jgi:hypothetical protein
VNRPPDSAPLPRHYWPIMFVWLLFWGIVGIALAIHLGVNPYIGFLIGWCIPLFIEVYRLARKERRAN